MECIMNDTKKETVKCELSLECKSTASLKAEIEEDLLKEDKSLEGLINDEQKKSEL